MKPWKAPRFAKINVVRTKTCIILYEKSCINVGLIGMIIMNDWYDGII